MPLDHADRAQVKLKIAQITANLFQLQRIARKIFKRHEINELA
jgi:hypothetical protein